MPRNPRKNDDVVGRMGSSIRESTGEVVDGYPGLEASRKLGILEVPVILCGEWTPQQVKAFRLLVNRSVEWATWDEEQLSLELQEPSQADFDLDWRQFPTRR